MALSFWPSRMPPAVFEDQLAHGLAERHFVDAGLSDVAADGDEAQAGCAVDAADRDTTRRR